MINEHYAIAVDPSHRLIATTLTGIWTCEIVDRYKADLLAAGARLMAVGVDAGHIGLLIDTRSFGAQPQAVVAYYARVFGERRFQSERIAVLYTSMLLKMQTRRMAVGKPRFFEQRDDAIRWLLSFDRVGLEANSAPA